MIHLLPIALKSAWNRRYTLGLTLIAIALSVTLLLGIERLRQDARDSFADAVSGTDLVVGARSSPMQLLLYAVFHIGEASNNISWQSALALAAHPAVAWTIPISLGDSHHGFPVLGTTPAYFEHFLYGDKQPLRLAQGKPFSGQISGLFDAVLGAEVAARLGYQLGDRITLAHGMQEHEHEPGHAEHGDKPFTVVGILARTGTPVDRTVHIGLAAMEAIHLDWRGGAPIPGFAIPPEFVKKFDLTPKAVSAVLVGLKTRVAVFAMQRYVADYREEALLAVMPGVALSQLWELLAVAERALLAISALVLLVSFAGLVAVVLAGLGERRRELAILRSVGARPRDLFALLALEGGAVTLTGALLGTLLLTLSTAALGPWLEARYGLVLRLAAPTLNELQLLGWVIAVGTFASLLPGYRAYRLSLADGLTPRV
ncbi:MAG: ABC transporter permease [Gallionellaceae bacterium]|nr:ABC transporter permease [Gallionellaceae bacterium]